MFEESYVGYLCLFIFIVLGGMIISYITVVIYELVIKNERKIDNLFTYKDVLLKTMRIMSMVITLIAFLTLIIVYI